MEVGVEIGKKEGPVGRSWEEGKRTGAVERVEGERSKGEKRENPWGKSRAGNPGEAWQPESWKPGGGKR